MQAITNLRYDIHSVAFLAFILICFLDVLEVQLMRFITFIFSLIF